MKVYLVMRIDSVTYLKPTIDEIFLIEGMANSYLSGRAERYGGLWYVDTCDILTDHKNTVHDELAVYE